ncbi:MAG: DUF4214 domain-containing protein [Telluria sp.]
MNGDGFADIFIHPSYFTSGPALAPIVLLNDGKGGFSYGHATVFKGLVPTIEQSNGVFIGNFTNDGRLGMFVVDQGLELKDSKGNFSGAINHFYLQDADGSWRDLTAALPNNGKSFNHVSSVVDFNGDGNLDVLVTRLGGPNFDGFGTFVYFGDGKGGFTSSTAGIPDEIKYTPNTQRNWNLDFQVSGAAHAADLNNDGRIDLVTGSYTDADNLTGKHTVNVYEQNANAQFKLVFQSELPAALAKLAGVMGVAGIDAADLDNDGITDLVVRWENQSYTAVEVLKGLGNHQYRDATTDMLGSYLAHSGANVDATGSAQQVSYKMELEDLNHDGFVDLLLRDFDSNANQTAGGLDTGASVFLNNGAGHFTPATFQVNGSPVTASQLAGLAGTATPSLGALLTFDANNDGKADFVYLSGTDTGIHVATLYGDDTGNIYIARDNATTVASAADDRISIGQGSSVIDGGRGLDTLVLAGDKADYRIGSTPAGFTLEHNHEVSVLTNVERLKFNDISVALDIAGNAGHVFRLYQAAFDRAPDPVGLGFWIHAADAGLSMTAIASGFTHSNEFAQLYGANVSDPDYVAHLYQNVLHRPYEQSGFDFWVAALGNGVSRETLLSNFAESAENVAALSAVMINGVQYMPFASA